jgi:serine/threonine-protein kinase
MIGQTISHYRILEKLGEGGMGIVYKAEDTKLRRTVALKFLLASVDASRLLYEAQAAAAIHHPNVCTVFEVDDNHRFIAIEFIEGQTLKEMIADRPLRAQEALKLGLQIGEGLGAAHAKGIVHRDVKSGNVMVTDAGHAKVMDFGLARRGTESGLTKEGAVAGTLGSMAPEQLAGAQVDHRADIWAFGALLHEMLTGRLPVPGAMERLSPDLGRIVRKALANEPAARYQHIEDLLVDLRQSSRHEHAHSRRRALAAAIAAIGTFVGFGITRIASLFERRAAGASSIRSLAVLPLRNLTRDPEEEFFSDATTEALITSLAQIRSLKVISRTSAMRYKQTDKPLPAIASELGVDGIVIGSIQRTPKRVRVSVQLVHASSDANLWARDYDRDASDMLLLQSEVARSIADEIRANITPAEQKRLRRAQSRSAEAQDAYLLGRYHFWRTTERELAEAIRNFDRAIQLDPNFAAAYAGLSDAWRQRGVWGASTFHGVLPKARAAALKALELDRDLAAAHSALASILTSYDWEWDASEKHFRTALELDPNNLEAHWGYGILLQVLGRFSEAIAEMERCVALDPLSAVLHSTYGRVLYRARKYPEAKAHLERALELDGEIFAARYRLGDVYEALGDYSRALDEHRKRFTSQGSADESEDPAIARLYALMGRRDEARRILNRINSPPQAESGRNEQVVALAYFALGDREKGFRWLERAFERRDLVTFVKFEPKFDSVRSDPRFQAIVKRLNIPDPE